MIMRNVYSIDGVEEGDGERCVDVDWSNNRFDCMIEKQQITSCIKYTSI